MVLESRVIETCAPLKRMTQAYSPLIIVVLGTQATPALTNLWNRYELMGVQLREAITPLVTPATQPSSTQLVNSMQSFSRRQGARNRYGCARTEGVVVVRSEVAITTANAPPSTPRSAGRASTLLPLPHQMSSLPNDVLVGPGELGFRAPRSSLAARRSQTPSQREDDLESLVSVCSGMSSICDRVDSDIVIDHTVMNDPGNDRLSQTLTDVDPVLHQGWLELLVLQPKELRCYNAFMKLCSQLVRALTL